MFQKFICNITGKVRREKLHGRDYLVAPMVMMVPGVHAGSQGPLLYKPDRMQTVVNEWNHKPIVVNHPKENDQFVSACSPPILEKYAIGLILNTRWDNGWKAEAWVEETRLDTVDGRIKQALATNTPMELSTGVFVDVEEESGEENGKQYVGVTANYRPDHLALLTDTVGACSMADGAGLLVNEMVAVHFVNAKPHEDILRADFVANAKGSILSFDEINNLVRQAMKKEMPGMDCWVEALYTDFVVYYSAGTFYKRPFEISGDYATFTGPPMQVVKRVEFTPPVPIVTNEAKMKREEIIAGLVANGFDPVAAAAMSDETLQNLAGIVKRAALAPAPVAPGTAPVAPVAPAANASPVAPVAPVANAQPVTLDQYLATAPSEIQMVLRDALATNASKRVSMVDAILANTRNAFTREQLLAMPNVQLEGVHKLAANSATETNAWLANAGYGSPMPTAPVANGLGNPDDLILEIPRSYVPATK